MLVYQRAIFRLVDHYFHLDRMMAFVAFGAPSPDGDGKKNLENGFAFVMG